MKRFRITFPISVLAALIAILVITNTASAALPAIRVAASVKDSQGVAAAFDNTDITVRSGKSGASALNAGMIFDDIDIPAGSTIFSAIITWTASASRSLQAINTRIYAEDNAAPADFGATENFTSRTMTTAYADFDVYISWTLNAPYDSTDLTEVVQELVDSYAPYAAGSMAFYWLDDTSTADKYLEAYSWDNDPAKAPLLTVYYSPPDAYWIGDTGTWTPTGSSGHWSLSSGGAGDPAISPGQDTDVHFDANSFAVLDQVVTFPQGTSLCAAHDIDFTGVLYTPTAYILSSYTNTTVTVTGSLTLSPDMIWYHGNSGYTFTFLFTSGDAETINTFDNTLSEATGDALNLQFNGLGSWTLLSDFSTPGDTKSSLNIDSGSFITDDYDLYLGYGVEISDTATRTVDLGDSNIYCNRWDATNTNNLTFSPGTSEVFCAETFIGGGLTYYDVQVGDDATNSTITFANTFHDLTIVGSNLTTTLNGNQTVTGTFTGDGSSGSEPLNLFSDAYNTPRTITAANIAVDYVNFRDITSAGAGDWDLSTDFSGDCGGNTGITFPSSISVYAVGIGAIIDWSNSMNWASTSGGVAGSGRVPLPQDMAIFDIHSIVIPGSTITLDMVSHSGIDAMSVTNTPIFTTATAYFYNSFNLGNVTWSVTNTYMFGRRTQTLSSESTLINLYLRPLDYSVSLTSDLICSGTIYHQAGIFNTDVTNSYDVIAGTFDTYTTTTYLRTLVFNNSDIILTSTAVTNKWHASATNLTLQAGTSTIYFTSSGTNTSTFRGGGITYYDLVITGVGNYTTSFADANTFDAIHIDRSEANKTINSNYAQTISYLELPPSDTRIITITDADFIKTAGVVLGDYLVISGSSATGGADFYANTGGHSTNNGGNTGWIWTLPDDPTVSTANATDVTELGEMFNGQLLTAGSYEAFYCYFDYGPSVSYGYTTSGTDLTAPDTFSVYISPYHVYHYRAVVRFGYYQYVYGADKVATLTGSGGPARSDVVDPGESTGTPLVSSAPDEIPRMYVSGNTGGLIGLGEIIDPALAESGTPVEAFWYPIAFLIAIVLGFVAYGLTRSLLLQGIVSACVMAAFAGGGVLGDGLLPFWTVVIFLIEIVFIWLVQERQNI